MNDQRKAEVELNWMNNEVWFHCSLVGLNDWLLSELQSKWNGDLWSQKERLMKNKFNGLNGWLAGLIWFQFQLPNSFKFDSRHWIQFHELTANQLNQLSTSSSSQLWIMVAEINQTFNSASNFTDAEWSLN